MLRRAGSASEGAPCRFLPSNGANWGIFVAKWNKMSNNSFKVRTFTSLVCETKNVPTGLHQKEHHAPFYLQMVLIGAFLLQNGTKCPITASKYVLHLPCMRNKKCPNFPILHHLPMSQRENHKKYFLLKTKI